MIAQSVRCVLVMLRHGQSAANVNDSLSGWLDVPLTDDGRREAVRVGELVAAHGLVPAVVHTSVLSRAVETAELAVASSGAAGVQVHRTWRLNERNYGVLQGRKRAEVRAEVGDELFMRWRRSYEVGPPGGESLADVRARLLPYWHAAIAPRLIQGETTLVVSHGNCLRALCMYLDELDPGEVCRLDLPTGVALVYELDDRLRPLRPGGRYLGPRAAEAGIAEASACDRAPDKA